MADQADSQPSATEESSVDDGNMHKTAPVEEASGTNSQEDAELNELLNRGTDLRGTVPSVPSVPLNSVPPEEDSMGRNVEGKSYLGSSPPPQGALEDFDKVKLSGAQDTQSPSSVSAEVGAAEVGAAGGKQGGESDPLSGEFSEVFSQQFAAQFEETMASIMSQNPQVVQQFETLAQAAESAGDSEEAQQNFMDTLTHTLVDMSRNADGIQEETLEGQSQAEGQGEDFMPMMQELMQTLLSKNVLYPSLKEISTKYPAYLSENENKLEASDLEVYRKQYELMTSICSLYEEEQPTDPPHIKTQRFEKLLDQMQQMQELGQPPKDIVGEMAPGLEFDENGMPKLPGMAGSQCRMM